MDQGNLVIRGQGEGNGGAVDAPAGAEGYRHPGGYGGRFDRNFSSSLVSSFFGTGVSHQAQRGKRQQENDGFLDVNSQFLIHGASGFFFNQ